MPVTESKIRPWRPIWKRKWQQMGEQSGSVVSVLQEAFIWPVIWFHLKWDGELRTNSNKSNMTYRNPRQRPLFSADLQGRFPDKKEKQKEFSTMPQPCPGQLCTALNAFRPCSENWNGPNFPRTQHFSVSSWVSVESMLIKGISLCNWSGEMELLDVRDSAPIQLSELKK